MVNDILAGRRVRAALFVVAALAGVGLMGRSADAQSLSCGSINPHAVVLAADQGQTPAQGEDSQDHTLPWNTDLAQSSGQSNAHKRIEAACADNGKSITVRITGSEWGDVQKSRTDANPQSMAGWAPVWSTHVTLPAGKQLDISVASGVSYLTCALVAPGVSMNWGIPFRDNQSTAVGVSSFDVTLSCTSGGVHNISPALANDWVDGELILVNLAIANSGAP